MRAFHSAVAAVCLSGWLLLPSFAFGFDLFKKENADVKEGNALLKQGKPDKAIASYNRAAQSLPKNHAVNLNRGLALSRLGDEQFDDAVYALKMAAESHGPAPIQARALGSLGNAFFKKEDYAEAIDYYKKSLRLSPGNKDVAWNLELAFQRKQELDKKQNQENKDQPQKDQKKQEESKDNKDKKEEDKKEEDKKDKDKQEQEKKDKQEQEKKDKQQQDQEKKDKKEDEKKSPKPEQPKTKQEVEQLLDSLDNQQDNLQKKMAEQRAAAMLAARFKDW